MCDSACLSSYISILTINMQPKEHNFHGLTHSATLIEDELRRKLAPLGLLPKQARVLMAMHHMAPVSQADLAHAFAITPASMSTMTDRLIANGYITRNPDPATRRRNLLELTKAGHAKLGTISGVWDDVDATIRDILGPEDAQLFFDLARRLRNGLGGRPPESG